MNRKPQRGKGRGRGRGSIRNQNQNNTFLQGQDERGLYAVNLRISPVTHGILIQHCKWLTSTLVGINAFNHYFKLLEPLNGETFPDVWDGYYHITLGKFRFPVKEHYELQKMEEDLRNALNELEKQIKIQEWLPQTFIADELEIHSGDNRIDDMEGIDFVVLKVNCVSTDFQEKVRRIMNKLLDTIVAKGCKWESGLTIDNYINRLHVTIRKYSGENSYWSKEQVEAKASELKSLVRKNPIKFECNALDIVQARQQGITRRRLQDKNYEWWSGVTELMEKDRQSKTKGKKDENEPMICSGCDYNLTKKWDGYCVNCANYEINKPIWSTDKQPLTSALKPFVSTPLAIPKKLEPRTLNRPRRHLSLDFIVPLSNEEDWELEKKCIDSIVAVDEQEDLSD
ncbi:unnamed protein product [Didymodactylos carnosus]|uniref:Uncharacterized protein n=1 Tax=Didymodactylos carnosus TaxID=1234261 RepID=A0A814ZVW5_9BILA|nr:unnamed protein product [Didymodactylos carnosus]CAF1292832.1 unnamed protein product [Didymodactylos carnosus]CAF4017362.1 unnamed protein product [Didymodactylos carnosus]CAF4097646.1 unnamed protein product [Didymodactylos carnosus]